MSKLGGILFIAIAVFVAVTLYTEGPREAFGGILAPLAGSEAPDEPYVPPHDRAAKRWRGAHQTGIDRVDEALGTAPLAEEEDPNGDAPEPEEPEPEDANDAGEDPNGG